MEILIVDDERVLRDAMKNLLVSEGYDVRVAANGESAKEQIHAKTPDLVLLDVLMPGKNGFAVCQEIRADYPALPILFLTAKDSDGDELRGFGVGADDFLSKSTPEQILLARIRAVLRRQEASAQTCSAVFSLGEATVDALRQKIHVDGHEADLTVREIEILRWFASNVGTVASHDFLLTRFWGVDANVTLSALHMQIKRLREKMGTVGACLTSVHAQGYALRKSR